MTCRVDLKTSFNEESSGAIGFTLTGLDDEAVTPNELTWTMTDVNGVVINSRQDVSATPASTTWVVLSGADLALVPTSNVRVMTIKGTYNTVIGGVSQTNLPYTGEYQFDVCSFLNIPDIP